MGTGTWVWVPVFMTQSGIEKMSDGRSKMEDVWYTLDGRRLTGKPTTKGIYINGRRKVVIK
jgi:hypothetical protein